MGGPGDTVSNKQIRFLPGRLVDKIVLDLQPAESGILSAAVSCCRVPDQLMGVMASRASFRPEQLTSTDEPL